MPSIPAFLNQDGSFTVRPGLTLTSAEVVRVRETGFTLTPAEVAQVREAQPLRPQDHLGHLLR